MTIVTCVKVRDGLVLGTDSMAHIQRGGHVPAVLSERHQAVSGRQPSDGRCQLGIGDDEELFRTRVLLAGYSAGQVFSEIREFQLPGDSKPRTTAPKELLGATWRGVEAPFFRLAMGYGFLVRQRLEAAGLDEAVAGELLDDLGIDVVFDGMPVQDAVEYATFILNTTIGYTTFSMELSPCGGPLQVATILPGRTFNWLARPEVHI